MLAEETHPLGCPHFQSEAGLPGHAQAQCLLFALCTLLGLAILFFNQPCVGSHRTFGQTSACKSNCKNIATALQMYASDNSGYYPDRLEPALIQGKYLRYIPTCPAAGKATYRDSYHTYRRRTAFRFCCTGNHHARAYVGFQGSSENFPAYNSRLGLLEHP